MSVSTATRVTTIPRARETTEAVTVDKLVCSGCCEPVVAEPPAGWPGGAGVAPEFSHRDGSVLCPDSRGRLGEPVEVRS